MTNVREHVETTWQNLQDTLQGIPEDRMTEAGVCGEWSVKDLVGHIAFWDDRIITAVEAEVNGRELEPVDLNTLNDEVAAERSNWSLEHARQEFEAAHERLLNAIARYPDVEPASSNWAEADCTWNHYAEHGAQIHAWREQQRI